MSVCFGVSVRMRNSLEQHRPTNDDTLKWFENLQKEGRVSEERIKNEAEIFFNKEIKEDKKVVKKKLLGLVQKRNNVVLQFQRKLQKDLGGLGKHFEKAPLDFGLDINEEKRRNFEFVKMCRAEIRNSAGYLEWLDEECTLMLDSKVEKLKKIQAEKDKILESAEGTETLKVVRERSSGPSITDTTCVSVFVQILLSIQCKIFQYTFSRRKSNQISRFLFSVSGSTTSMATN